MKGKEVYLFIPIFLCGFVFVAFSYINSKKSSQETANQSEPAWQVPNTPSQENTATNWNEEEAKQPERSELIQKLINRGIFQKVDYWEHGATVIVDSNFYLLDFEDKKDFVSVVYAYVTTKTQDDFAGVVLKDNLSNKTVGTYDSSGLEMK
jgi:hypothetical protein